MYGYAEPYKAGLDAGKEDTKWVGLKAGFEVAQQLGFYRGCVDAWNSAIRIQQKQFLIRVCRDCKRFAPFWVSNPSVMAIRNRLQMEKILSFGLIFVKIGGISEFVR